jgi:hypothetical protein
MSKKSRPWSRRHARAVRKRTEASVNPANRVKRELRRMEGMSLHDQLAAELEWLNMSDPEDVFNNNVDFEQIVAKALPMSRRLEAVGKSRHR